MPARNLILTVAMLVVSAVIAALVDRWARAPER
jgi:hypothetical protein